MGKELKAGDMALQVLQHRLPAGRSSLHLGRRLGGTAGRNPSRPPV